MAKSEDRDLFDQITEDRLCPSHRTVNKVVSVTFTMTSAKNVHVISSSDESDDCEMLPLYQRILLKQAANQPKCITTDPSHFNLKLRVTGSTGSLSVSSSPPTKRPCERDLASSAAIKRQHPPINVSSSEEEDQDELEDLPEVCFKFARNSPSKRKWECGSNSQFQAAALSNGFNDDERDLDVYNRIDAKDDFALAPVIPEEKATKSRVRKEPVVIKSTDATDKAAERNAKKKEKELEKLSKQMRQENLRNSKPTECVKFIKVYVDAAVLELPEANNTLALLRESEVFCCNIEQVVPFSVTWKREVPRVFLDANRMINTALDQIEEKEVLVFVPMKKFVTAVHAFKQKQAGNYADETLRELVLGFKDVLPGKNVTVMACGMHQYFQAGRRKKQADYRQNVLGESAPSNAKSKKKKAESDFCSLVSRIDVEEALVDLQINEVCNVRLVDNSLEVAEIIASFTKALAKASSGNPEEDGGVGKSNFALFAPSDWRQTVKVDKTGNGLLLLWQRQIEQFHMITADAAQAVIAKYPSPRALIKAYRKCSSPREGQALLQDIVIRRGVGPLANTRKIGPELSRKMYILFTATSGELILESK